jgi:hypothetical protein
VRGGRPASPYFLLLLLLLLILPANARKKKEEKKCVFAVSGVEIMHLS